MILNIPQIALKYCYSNILLICTSILLLNALLPIDAKDPGITPSNLIRFAVVSRLTVQHYAICKSLNLSESS